MPTPCARGGGGGGFGRLMLTFRSFKPAYPTSYSVCQSRGAHPFPIDRSKYCVRHDVYCYEGTAALQATHVMESSSRPDPADNKSQA